MERRALENMMKVVECKRAEAVPSAVLRVVDECRLLVKSSSSPQTLYTVPCGMLINRRPVHARRAKPASGPMPQSVCCIPHRRTRGRAISIRAAPPTSSSDGDSAPDAARSLVTADPAERTRPIATR